MHSAIDTIVIASRVESKTDKLVRSMRLWSIALLVSGLTGVFAGVTGLAINILFVLRIAENNGLMGMVGIWLLVGAFPMLWLTSHCLDRIDTIDKDIRYERCLSQGFTPDACDEQSTNN